MMGLEPTTTGTTSRGSTIELHPPYRHLLARLAGLEPATYGLEGRCSIQLSYRRSQVASNHATCKLKWSGQGDSNTRPSGPKPDALPGCAMPRDLSLHAKAADDNNHYSIRQLQNATPVAASRMRATPPR